MHAQCAFSYIHYGQLIYGKAGQRHVQLTVVAAYTYIQSATHAYRQLGNYFSANSQLHSYKCKRKCMSKSYIKYHGASLSSFDTEPFLVRLDHFQLAKNGLPKPNFYPKSVQPLPGPFFCDRPNKYVAVNLERNIMTPRPDLNPQIGVRPIC